MAKNLRLNVKLDAQEQLMIKSKAQSLGMTQSELVRKAVESFKTA